MINTAIKLDEMVKDSFVCFKKYFDKVERECLNNKELAALSNKEINMERLRHVRDMFLFSCYSKLAYINLAEL